MERFILAPLSFFIYSPFLRWLSFLFWLLFTLTFYQVYNCLFMWILHWSMRLSRLERTICYSLFPTWCCVGKAQPICVFLYFHITTTLTTLLTPGMWPFPHWEILWHQLGVLQCNSILTPSTWKQQQTAQVKRSAPQDCPSLQMSIPSPGGSSCFWSMGCKSEFPMVQLIC